MSYDPNTTERTIAEMIDIKDKRLDEYEMTIGTMNETIQRLRSKIAQDAEIKRKLMFRIKELGGDVVVIDKDGVVS